KIESYDIIENNPYFKKLGQVANSTELSWTHIDLLFIRETNQNKIHHILRDEENCGPEFIYQQLLVADKLIKYTNPKVIVVCNALASLFFGKEKTVNSKGEEVN